jgi:hypothetical protein
VPATSTATPAKTAAIHPIHRFMLATPVCKEAGDSRVDCQGFAANDFTKALPLARQAAKSRL